MAKSLVEELKQLIIDNHWELNADQTPPTSLDRISVSVLDSYLSEYDECSHYVDDDSVILMDLWHSDKRFACISLLGYQQTTKPDDNDKDVEEQKQNSTIVNLLDEQKKAQIVAIIKLLMLHSDTATESYVHDANIQAYMHYATNKVCIIMPHSVCALYIEIEFKNKLVNLKESLPCSITYSLVPTNGNVAILNASDRSAIFARMSGALYDVCETNKFTLGTIMENNLYEHINVTKEKDSILRTLMATQQYVQAHYDEYVRPATYAQRQPYAGGVSCVGDVLMLLDTSTEYGHSTIYGMLTAVAIVANKCYRLGYQVEKLVYPNALFTKWMKDSSSIQTIYFRIAGSRLHDIVGGKEVPCDPVPMIAPVDILITFNLTKTPNLYIIQNRRILSYVKYFDFINIDRIITDIYKFIGLE